MLINFLRKVIPDTNPFRLLYYKIMAIVAAVFYWFPADKMIVVGVTGTNGKTTTVNLITNILNTAGYKVGMISTINFQVGEERWVNDLKQTTLSPFQTQKLLKRMRREGCKYVVLEISSHALTQSRVFGINIDVGVITNVTPEHVEYHGGFNNYLNAKGKLFEKVSTGRRKFGVPKVLVLNSDDQYFGFFNQFVADRKISYGIKSGTIFADNIEQKAYGSHFLMHVPNNMVPVELRLPGEFNIANALAAASVAISLEVPLDKVKQGLDESTTVAGRFEHIFGGQGYSVIVDYAHDPQALRNVLEMYRKLTPGRLFSVFGATGGGRDKAKRPQMGAVANELADYIILTNDDPYVEDEWEIIEGIAIGVPRQEGKSFWKIPDRREALRLALTLAREGDTVVVSGKGAEETMLLRGKKITWNDKKVITELLEREVEVEIGPGSFEKRENVCKLS